jgi:hypothetical protein
MVATLPEFLRAWPAKFLVRLSAFRSRLRSGLPRNEGTLRLEAAISKEYTGACPEALRGNADNRITEVETSPR